MLITGDHSCAIHVGQSNVLHGCTMDVLDAYRHFHSSVGVMFPCMSSSTHETERLWTPPPQDVEQEVHGLLSHLTLEILEFSGTLKCFFCHFRSKTSNVSIKNIVFIKITVEF